MGDPENFEIDEFIPPGQCIVCGQPVEDTPRVIQACDACIAADPMLGMAP